MPASNHIPPDRPSETANREQDLPPNAHPAQDGTEDIVKDITERPGGEGELRVPSDSLKHLLDNADDLIYLLDTEGRFTFINQQARAVTGFNQGEWIGKSFQELVVPEERRRAAVRVKETCLGHSQKAETRIAHADGRVITLSIHETPVRENGRVIGVFGIARDVSEKQRVEQQTREFEEMYRDLFENVNDGIYVLDMFGNFIMVNKKIEEVLGYGRQELIGKHFSAVIAPENLDMVARSVEERIATGTKSEGLVGIVLSKTGERITVEFNSTPLMKDGRAIALLGVARDITERIRMEQKIRSLMDLNEKIILNAPLGTFTTDSAGKITSANPALARILGFDHPSEIIGTDVFNLQGIKELGLGDIIEREQEKGSIEIPPFTYTSTRGKEVFLRAVYTPLRNDEGQIEGGLTLLEDITERSVLEQQLLQSEKLSALGELISEIVHELNNPLTGMLGYVQFLMEDHRSEPVRDLLDKIGKEANRCSRIVRSLLDFARIHKPQKTRVRIEEALDGTLALREYQLLVDNVRVIKNYGQSIPEVDADIHQIQQVFLNIINNAHQAMLAEDRERTLTIETEAVDSIVRVKISDTGSGIPLSNLKRIFDPFFTTKEPGQGTGLGLSLSYTIVKEHGGTLYADSRPGKGSTFVVELPTAAEDKATSPTVRPIPEDKPVPGKKILVVDDEQVILDLMRDVLSGDGHCVDVARDGTVALEKIAGEDYDLVITDLKMPGIAGEDIYEYVKRTKPSLTPRIIFSTGNTLAPETRAFFRETGNNYIGKPFDLITLRAVVRKTLLSDGP